MTKTKFNVIFDLDHTIIKPISGGMFPKHKDDWQFKANVLELILDVYKAGGFINIYTNQAGVTFGYNKPVDVQEMVLDVFDNIIEFIHNETGIRRNKILRRFNQVIVMGYNSIIRKGIELTDAAKQYLIYRLGINKHKCNIFIGDGSGIDITYNFTHELSNKQLTEFMAKTSKVINCKVTKVPDTNASYRILSCLKTDIIAASELSCDAYYDIDLLLRDYKDAKALWYNLPEFVDYNYINVCPNLLLDKDVDFGIKEFSSKTIGFDPTKFGRDKNGTDDLQAAAE